MRISFLLIALVFCGLAFAEETHVVDIDLSSVCLESEKQASSETMACQDQNHANSEIISLEKINQDIQKHQICHSLEKLESEDLKPLEIGLIDNEGTPWKIRFHFGFTRTNFRPTDVKVNSSVLSTTIKGFEFDERTSALHYNPGNWKNFQDAFRWIDEPSNTFEISIENKKNAFYITAFHPKTLATYHYKGDSFVKADKDAYLSYDPFITKDKIPEGHSAVEIQNTHMLMNYSVGYGRRIKVFESPKAGGLSYVARVDLGAMVGGARTLHFTEDKTFTEGQDKLGIQGATVALGHRAEYQKGKVGVFVEQKYTKSKLEHGFLDGQASYNLDFSTITFGVSIDLLKKGR